MPAWPVRFAVEAVFIVGVAVLAWFLTLPTWGIVVVMAGSWLVVVFVEIALSRELAKPRGAKREARPASPKRERPSEPRVRGGRAPAGAREAQPVVKHVRVVPADEKPAAAAAPEAPPAASRPEPEPAPVAVKAPPLPEPEPEPVRAAPEAAEPKREPVPEPTPKPRAAPPPPAGDGPRQWNLWELERRARDHGGDDAGKDEEWAFLVVYLREFADPDGLLPAHFDNLVRESFADLIGSVAR
jgi:hypothetical protein